MSEEAVTTDRERVPRPWRAGNGNARCQECGAPNGSWWVERAVWNQVMGGNHGVLCPNCFILEARDVGIGRSGAWQLYPPASLR